MGINGWQRDDMTSAQRALGMDTSLGWMGRLVVERPFSPRGKPREEKMKLPRDRDNSWDRRRIEPITQFWIWAAFSILKEKRKCGGGKKRLH